MTRNSIAFRNTAIDPVYHILLPPAWFSTTPLCDRRLPVGGGNYCRICELPADATICKDCLQLCAKLNAELEATKRRVTSE